MTQETTILVIWRLSPANQSTCGFTDPQRFVVSRVAAENTALGGIATRTGIGGVSTGTSCCGEPTRGVYKLLEQFCLYGPPGAGKTTKLTQIAIAAVKVYGLDGIAACTFTKGAAEEIRERIGAALGLEGNAKSLRARLPWIGTIHSLAYRLIGATPSTMVSNQRIGEFCSDQKIPTPKGYDAGYEPEVPYFELPSNPNEIELVRGMLSAAAHRMIPPEDAIAFLPAEDVGKVGRARLLYLATQFVAWKQARKLFDFDDLLILGMKERLPVKCIIADEAQDNSALLWKVLDGWAAQSVERLVVAGDPFQSIFSFMGADPALFLGRPGKWTTIGNSHRFGPNTAEFCRGILLRAFGDEAAEKLATWDGIGGTAVAGDHLYLARTNNLLTQFTNQFHAAGTPYRKYRGRAPLQTKAADAYRTLHFLLNGHEAPLSELLVIKDQIPRGYLTSAQGSMLERQAKARPAQSVDAAEAEQLLAGYDLRRLQVALPRASYFDLVLRNHGLRGLISEPTTIAGTCHSAKGREADRVTLHRSWATLPGRAISTPNGRRQEACVANVACSRHRTSLTIVDGYNDRGVPYPFPGGGVTG